MKNGWGAQAVALGLWEAGAFAGVLPPVSRAYAAARRRYGRKADLALALWLFGLARHLIRYELDLA